MNRFILEDGSLPRRHRVRLGELLSSTTGRLRFATAYVTDREIIKASQGRDVQLLISLLPMDIASGATSIETLGWMLKSGVSCRVLPDRPRLHAKVYIFGNSNAVITSANLTTSALHSNIEVGAEFEGEVLRKIESWFDGLWRIGSPLSIDDLFEIQSSAPQLRDEYASLRQRAKTVLYHPIQRGEGSVLSDSVQDLFANAPRFFICNTDRRQGARTPTGGWALEQEMCNRGFAAAWETFRYPRHMEQVERGDAILMFARGIGIIGIGVATASCETLAPNDRSRIRKFQRETNTPEWRVPVNFLEWTDEADAFPYKSAQPTFLNVSDSKYDSFRQELRSHFIGDT